MIQNVRAHVLLVKTWVFCFYTDLGKTGILSLAEGFGPSGFLPRFAQIRARRSVSCAALSLAGDSTQLRSRAMSSARFGWEVLALRCGAVMGRLEDVADEIRRYLAGELDVIEELEETPLESVRAAQHFENLVTPSAMMGMGF